MAVIDMLIPITGLRLNAKRPLPAAVAVGGRVDLHDAVPSRYAHVAHTVAGAFAGLKGHVAVDILRADVGR